MVRKRVSFAGSIEISWLQLGSQGPPASLSYKKRKWLIRSQVPKKESHLEQSKRKDLCQFLIDEKMYKS